MYPVIKNIRLTGPRHVTVDYYCHNPTSKLRTLSCSLNYFAEALLKGYFQDPDKIVNQTSDLKKAIMTLPNHYLGLILKRTLE